MLQVALIDDLHDMREAAFDFLARDEANNTIALNALGMAWRAHEAGEAQRGDPLRMVIAREHGDVVALGVRSLGSLLLAGNEDAHARAIAQAMRDDPSIHGIVGREAMAHACAAAWGRAFGVHVRLILQVLAGTPDGGGAAGAMRLARTDEYAQLVQWQRDFEIEARLLRNTGQPSETVAQRMARAQAYVWCDGDAIVSHAGAVAIAPTGARIGPVYTPPAQRGRGYAQALVAAVSRHLIDRGAQRVFLFTDAQNPTSNAVYQRVGFRFVSAHAHLEFVRD